MITTAPFDKIERAHKAVLRALRTGELVRPRVCGRCGKNPGKRSDGRSLVQAHHDDYDKPLKVKWRCPSCHRKETPEAGKGLRNGAYTQPDRVRKGESHGRSKVTAGDVLEMRRLFRQGIFGTYQLGQRYGLNHKTVRDAVCGNTWRSI